MSQTLDTPLQQLRERGIAQTAASYGARFVWHHQRPAVEYRALPTQAVRRKFFDGRKPKYGWETGHKEKFGAVYYIPQGEAALRAAIAAADGQLWIANGEPSLWAYHAAGCLNSICWFGEGSIPHTLSADLRVWGVTEVRNPADNDDGGRKSAKGVRSLLKESGIRYLPLEWGENLKKGYDANDAWIDAGFDAARFVERLQNLKALILPSDELPSRRPRPAAASGDRGMKKADAIAEIISRAESRQGRQAKRNGKYANFCCLLHEEREPSAGINVETGTYTCLAGCGSLSLAEVCERLNIDYHPYTPPEPPRGPSSSRPREQRPTQQAGQGSADQSAPETHPIQPHAAPRYSLPYTWRRGMVMINTSGGRERPTGNLGLMLECLILRGVKDKVINPAGMTFDEVAAFARQRGIELSDRTMRRVFDELKKVFLSVTDVGIVDDPVSLNDNNSTRKAGRPAQLWKLNDHQTAKAALAREMTKKVMERYFAVVDGVIPPLDVLKTALTDLDLPHDETVIASLKQVLEAAGELDKTAARKLIADTVADRLRRSLDDYQGEPIPDDFPMRTGADYLAAHAALRLRRFQGNVHLSQKQIADDLGVASRKVAARLIRRVGVAVTPSTVQEITLTPDRRIYEQVESARSKVKGKALSLKAVQRDGTVIRESYSMVAAQRLMNEGATVTVAIRTANMYAVTPDVRPIEAPPPAPRVVKPVQQQEQPAAPHVTIPAPSIERDDPDHIGYSRTWLRDQLALILSRHDGIEKQGGRFISRETGEIASMDASAADLLGLLIGQHVEQPADPLIAFAEQEFGAVAYDMSKSG